MSNSAGEFIFNVLPDNAIQVITAVGFVQQTIDVNGKSVVRIKLKLAVNGLDETILIAYEKTSKRAIHRQCIQVNAEAIQIQPVSFIIFDLETLKVSGRVGKKPATQFIKCLH